MKSMINAIIYHGENTLVLELPRSIYDIHEKLMSIGCPIAPGRIPLTDNEDDALRVKLYSRIEMGNHLIRILSEQNTLADANTLTFVVLNVSDDIKLKLGEKIAKDQYVSIPEIVADIRQMTYDAGPIKRTFYCPLIGNIEDGYDEEKLSALKLYLDQKQMQVEDELTKALDALYCKNVPAGVRDYFNLRSGTPEPVQPKVKKPRAEKSAPAIMEGHENEQH